jgi:hypothetical protein
MRLISNPHERDTFFNTRLINICFNVVTLSDFLQLCHYGLIERHR